MKKILFNNKTKGYLFGLEDFLISHFRSIGYDVCHEIADVPDFVLCFGFEELELVAKKLPDSRFIILDFHMLGGLEGRSDIINLINDMDMSILSCFPNFSYLYDGYGIREEKVRFISFSIDTGYLDKITSDLTGKQAGHILVPGNHKRDYDLMFDTIRYLEDRGMYLDYLIIDGSISKRYIGEKIKDNGIKSEIRYIKKVSYDVFLSHMKNSSLVFLPLKNEKHICNGLTVFATSVSMGKLIITNSNLTTSPFVKNFKNCICSSSDADSLGKYMMLIQENKKLIEKIGQGALIYGKDNFTFSRLAGEIAEELKKDKD